MQTAVKDCLKIWEQTTVLEQLGQDRHVFVSLPTGYGKRECLTVFPKLMDRYGRI